MYDITLSKKDEAFIKVNCDKSVAQELSDYFTFYVPGFQFTPAFKKKLWDGKIRLFDLRSFQIYHGLVPYIQKFCVERKYKLQVNSDIIITEEFSVKEANEFISTLSLPHEVREHQLNAFIQCIRNKRQLVVSPTASGKSLLIYLIIRYLQMTNKKGLIVVPTTSLVEQLFTDFESYGYDS